MAEKKPVESPGFEQALSRLEALVKEMESGRLTLEQMMAHFEEGSGLVKACSAKLNEVEKKIEVLVRKGDAVTTEPLDEKALRDDAG
jgi:exodeoxyribonuclease VII small subunit